MPTQVSFFIPPPNASGLHREVYAYGPSSSAFNTEVAVEIDPGQINNYPILAVTEGIVRLIPNAPPATTVTAVLIPSPLAMQDLSSVIGSRVLAFIYRNIDTASIRTRFELRIAALGNQPFLQSESLQDRVTRFLHGEFGIWVNGGEELGLASTQNGNGGWARLGFGITFLSSGLFGDAGWNRIRDMINPANDYGAHLDPMAFYSPVSRGTTPEVSLTPPHMNHLFLTLLTQRTLLEVRNEYGLPFVGTAEVLDGSTGGITTFSFTMANRGTVILATVPSGGTVPNITYTVSSIHHVFTELPSGIIAESTLNRTLTVSSHWIVQAIFMDDVTDPANWFLPNITPLPRFTSGNKITHLIDGLHTFREMVAIMHTIRNSNHYLRLVGWWLTDNFEMVPGDSASTFARLSQSMASAGAQIRALLWDQWGTQNSAEVDHINALPGGNGRGVLDNETPNYGSHHQKLVIVNGDEGAVAFCGGVDINPDRLDDDRHLVASPFHDIHIKVEGPALADLNLTFVQRWNNHPSNPPTLPLTPPPFTPNPGSQYVQVTRTFAPSYGYPFVPTGTGDLGTLNQVINAIRHAKRFIYLEDQYSTPYPGRYPYNSADDTVGILTALLSALSQPSLEYLIMVIPNHSDQPQNRYRRHKFIRPLRDAYPDKVHIFYLSRSGPPPTGPAVESTTAAADKNMNDPSSTSRPSSSSSSGGPKYQNEIYVHSKTWIIDDVYTKIGSANCNRRSYTHDTELDIHIIDGALLNGGRAFARRFRMDLWAEHLNMKGARRASLEDPLHALQFWLHPIAGARISPYDENSGHGTGNLDSIWNTFVDPDGR